MGLNLSTNLPMFVHTFQAMGRHRPLKEYSVFVGIPVASTYPPVWGDVVSVYDAIYDFNCSLF